MNTYAEEYRLEEEYDYDSLPTTPGVKRDIQKFVGHTYKTYTRYLKELRIRRDATDKQIKSIDRGDGVIRLLFSGPKTTITRVKLLERLRAYDRDIIEVGEILKLALAAKRGMIDRETLAELRERAEWEPESLLTRP